MSTFVHVPAATVTGPGRWDVTETIRKVWSLR